MESLRHFEIFLIENAILANLTRKENAIIRFHDFSSILVEAMSKKHF